MVENEYSLRCYFKAHQQDVRTLVPATLIHGGIVSGSRDRTVRIWKPKEDNTGFVEIACLLGPSHYVSSLCILQPNTEYPHGLVLAGSNDCAIHGFSMDTYQAIFKLHGHSGTVSSLVAGNFETILSGSLDKTARVWVGQKSVLVLSGHQEAVWAVAMFPDQGLMVTGSADNTIRLWRAGKTEKVFHGHEECVRGLAVVSHSDFLSCSNDCTIRLWQTNGNCLAIFSGHTNSVYAVTVLNEKRDFVSCGEDRTVRIWKSGTCVMLKEIPSSCLWSVARLSNGDFAVGGSNGNIYVFTQDDHYKAPQAVVDAYEAELTRMKQAVKQPRLEMGMPDDLPGPEVLLSPAVVNGQKVLCREGNDLVSFEWDAFEKAWRNNSNVNDLRHPNPNFKHDVSGYDQIFNIDVDGVIFKLPYRNCDNPYDAAQNFVSKHHITPAYVEKIAQHIIANTHLPSANNGRDLLPFADPFTGADRYIPSNKRFGCTVSPSSTNDPNKIPEQKTTFSVSKYLGFHTYNRDGLEKKLLEFSHHADKDTMVSSAEIKDLLLLIDFPHEVSPGQMESLQKILYWPDEYLFPALDVFRLAIRSTTVTEKVSEAGETTLMRYLLQHLNSRNPYANVMFTLRILCNFFGNDFGEKLLFNNVETICCEAAACVPTQHKQIEVALTTLYLNYAIAINKQTDRKHSTVTEKVIAIFSKVKDHEAIFRLMVCIGTLIEDHSAATVFKSVNIRGVLITYLASGALPQKNELCAKQLIERIK